MVNNNSQITVNNSHLYYNLGNSGIYIQDGYVFLNYSALEGNSNVNEGGGLLISQTNPQMGSGAYVVGTR